MVGLGIHILLRITAVGLMTATCRACGSTAIQFDEPAEEDWWGLLIDKSSEVPSRERCEAWLDSWGIPDETALDVARDIHNKLRWTPKTERWMPGGYLTIYFTWQSWCRLAMKRNGYQPKPRSGLITKRGGYW